MMRNSSSNNSILSLGLLCLATLLTPQQTLACSCLPLPSLSSSMRHAAMVTRVRVLEEVSNVNDTRTYRAEMWRPFSDNAGGCGGLEMQQKGARDVEIRFNLCGDALKEGAKYVLSGNFFHEEQDDGDLLAVLEIGPCDYQRKWNDLSKKELEYLYNERDCHCERDACGKSYLCPDGHTFGGPARDACHYDAVIQQCVATEAAICGP